jgi:hypothetical protein
MSEVLDAHFLSTNREWIQSNYSWIMQVDSLKAATLERAREVLATR